MLTLCTLTPPRRTGNGELGWYLLGAETLANTLYSTLSRHILRPTPYSARDLPSQIREHVAATPRATVVRELGIWTLTTLGKFDHCRPTAILTHTLQGSAQPQDDNAILRRAAGNPC